MKWDEKIRLTTAFSLDTLEVGEHERRFTITPATTPQIVYHLNMSKFVESDVPGRNEYLFSFSETDLPNISQKIHVLNEGVYLPDNAVWERGETDYDIESTFTPPDKGEISGHVLDQETKAPIPGAIVTYDERRSIADESGAYVCPELEFEEYDVEASSPGYLKLRIKVQVSAAQTYTRDFELTPEAPPPPPKGRIVGLIINIQTNDPIPEVEINFDSSMTHTFEDGNYNSGEMDPGHYEVKASKEGYEDQTKPADVTSGETTTLNFALTPTGPRPPPLIDCEHPPQVGIPLAQPLVDAIWFLFCPFINAIIKALSSFDIGKALENFGKTLSNLLLPQWLQDTIAAWKKSIELSFAVANKLIQKRASAADPGTINYNEEPGIQYEPRKQEDSGVGLFGGIAREMWRAVLGDFDQQAPGLVKAAQVSVSPESPAWKEDLEKALESLNTRVYDKIMDPINQIEETHSPITMEQALTTAGLVTAGGIAAVLASFLADTAGEICTLGQVEAIGKGARQIVEYTGIKSISTDILTAPVRQGVLPWVGRHFDQIFRTHIYERDLADELFIRGIIDYPLWKQTYNWYGFPDDYTASIRSRLRRLPGPMDLVRFLVREVITPEQFSEIMKQQGFGFEETETADIQIYTETGLETRTIPKTGAWFWTSHWIPPRRQELDVLLARGLITEDEHLKWLGIIDMDPRMVQKVRELRYRYPSRMETRIIHEIEPMADAELTKLMKSDQIHPDYLPKMVNWVKNFQSRIFRRRFLLALEMAFRKGRISETDLRAAILEAKYSEDVANWIIKTATLRKDLGLPMEGEFTEEDFTKAEIFALYRYKVIDAAETKKLLKEKGFAAKGVDLLMKLADAKYSGETPAAELALTKADVRALFLAGLLTEEEGRTELSSRGYDTREVELLIQLWTSKLPVEEAPPEAALTKADLQALFVAGLRSETWTIEQLKIKGYDALEISTLLELWTSKMPSEKPPPEAALTKADIEALFMAGLRDQPWTILQLKTKGYDDVEIKDLLDLWTSKLPTEKPPAEAALTKSEILSLWSIGELTDLEAKDRLKSLGFDAEEIDLLESLKNFTTLSSERTTMKTQLLNDHDEGILDDAQLEELLGYLAYSPGEIQLYLAQAQSRYRRAQVKKYLALFTKAAQDERMTLEQFQTALNTLPINDQVKKDLMAYVTTYLTPAEKFGG